MSFSPVLLWTDILIYFLLAASVAAIFYIRHNPHLRKSWLIVLQKKRGVIAAMILLSYVIIGVLDSIHFRPMLDADHDTGSVTQYATEVITVLDMMVMPLRQHTEKTYSAPLATRSFVREMLIADDGSVDYDYPRLIYAGSHLTDEQDKWADITNKVIKSSVLALAIWLLVCGVIITCMTKGQGNWSDRCALIACSPYPLITFFFMLAMLLIIGFNLAALSSYYHVFGTDKVGQDVLYQTLKSVRTGLVIGTLTTLIMLPIALIMGIIAGFFSGWVDDVIQYIYTTLNSIPGVLLIAATVLMLQVYITNHPDNFSTVVEQADIRLLFLCIILGVTSWTGLCRILRGETLKLRETEYVLAAKALGVSNTSILWRHILPNLMHIVLITIVLDFSGLVLAEAILSYVGVGVDPSMTSWGNMINSARLEMARDPVVWWSLTAAFLSMFVLVLAANLFADVVRDAFDPKSEQSLLPVGLTQ